MPGKPRGRERLLNCDSCGRRIPRDKAVSYDQLVVYTTDLKNADDVRTSLRREFHYCPSCGKHRHIYERKGRDAARRSARAAERGDRGNFHEQRGSGHIFGQAQKDSWSTYEPGGRKSGNRGSVQSDSQENESASDSGNAGSGQ